MNANGRTTIQIRIQSIIRGKYRTGTDILHVNVAHTVKAVSILKEAEEKLKELKNEDMSEM